jgi:hypothetical protein
VGDIISVSLLVKDLLLALDSSRGSSAEYQAVVRDLYFLDTALLQVEQLFQSRPATTDLQNVRDKAQETVSKCKASVAAFTAKVKDYGGSLATGGSGNSVKDAARKLRWRASHKQEEIARFRVEIATFVQTINMLLSTEMLACLNTSSESLKDQLSKNGQIKRASLDLQAELLREVRAKMNDYEKSITNGNGLIAQLMERVNYIPKLAADMKQFMCNLMAGNLTTYRELVSFRAEFNTHIRRPLSEDPFTLEDAIGRIAPVHLRFIGSWEAFHAVLEDRFRGKQGSEKVQKKQYVLQDASTGRDIDPSLDFGDAFLPGQRIAMSLLFQSGSASEKTESSAHCPGCNTMSKELSDADIQCARCKMWFRRITEIDEVSLPQLGYEGSRSANIQFGEPSFSHISSAAEPKRRLEEKSDEHFSRFKRIRLVERIRRFKTPKSFTSAKVTPTFDTIARSSTTRVWRFGGERFKKTRGTLDEDSDSSAFCGLVQEDIFHQARSKQHVTEGDTYKLVKLWKGRSYADALEPAICLKMNERINRAINLGGSHTSVPYLIQASLVRLSTYTDDVLPDYLPAPDINARLLPPPPKYACVCNSDEDVPRNATSNAINCGQCGTWQHHSCYYLDRTPTHRHRCARPECHSSNWYNQITKINARWTICISANPSSDIKMDELRSFTKTHDPALKIILVLLKVLNVPPDVSRWALYLNEPASRPRKLHLAESPLLMLSQLEPQCGRTDASLELRRCTGMVPNFAFGAYQCEQPECKRSTVGHGFAWLEDLIAHELEHGASHRTYTCSLCARDLHAFFSLEQLKRHTIARHTSSDMH